jgi:hypothetical protein
MSNDPASLAFKAYGTRYLMERFPNNLPCRRELAIQIEKLARMVDAFEKKYSAKVLTNRLRKQKGSDMHRLVQQSKLMDKLAAELFTGLSDQISAKHSTLTRQQQDRFRREVRNIEQGAIRVMNKHWHEGLQRMRQLTASTASKTLAEIREKK